MSTNNNAIVSKAVAGLNQQAEDAAVAEAMGLVRNINTYKAQRAGVLERIKTAQEALVKINGDAVTVENVVGSALADSPNTGTMVKAIEKLNAAKQNHIEAETNRLGNEIQSAKQAVADLDKKIAEQVEKLGKVAAPTITATELLG